MLSNKHTIALLFVGAVASGCYVPVDEIDNSKPWSYAVLPHHDPRYGIGFYNDTDALISGVRFEFQFNGHTYYCPAGYLSAGAEAQDGGGPDPIPVEGTVHWQTADGVKHQQHVLPAAAVKIERDGPDTIPVERRINWQTADGVNHQIVVPAAPAVRNQRNFDGTIWFKIGANGVLVESVTNAESWERADRHLPEVP